MIAEKSFRRKGIASRTLDLISDFLKENNKASKIVAKINETNNSSINLFKKKGFKLIKELKYFKQVEYAKEL